MKVSLLLLSLLTLVVISCSKGDSTDDNAKTVQKVTDEVVSTDLASSSSPATQVVAENREEEDDTQNDQATLETKSAFFQVEQQVNKEIGLEFAIDGNRIRSTMSKRCESAETADLVECLTAIKKSLNSFISRGTAVLGSSDSSIFRAEYAKLSLASDWVRRIDKNLMMVRQCLAIAL